MPFPRLVRRLVRLLLCSSICIALVPVVHAFAASDSHISGSVLDPDGKAVVDAVVLVRNEDSQALQATTTDRAGHFESPALTPGVYTLELAVPGFDLVRRNAIRVGGEAVDVPIHLTVANVAETVTVSAALPQAAVAAPSQGSLTARSAQSLISNEYIRNYTSPVSDFSQVLQMAPGTFSTSANGPGLSDTKTYFRGFKDGYYSMSFDGIPFNDTNDPTHHSWVFFPAQTIGSTVFDRSPGSAASIGPSTFGGSVSLLSPSLPAQQTLSGTISYGSFNTKLYDAQFDSGKMGPDGKMRLLVEGHQMTSDGYQTFNVQDRKAFQAKYQYAITDAVSVTAFTSVMDLHSNTPNQKGATRAQIAQNGDNFLMKDDPTSPLYYKFNFYHVPTNFEYVGVKANLGHGWSIDNKTYGMRYRNKQNYNSTSTISATSATDKLNSYWKMGNIIPVTHASRFGVLRTGLWSEYASTDRYQTPSDPRTWVNAALPNFHETFITTTYQPYAEYQLRVRENLSVTPGLKYARYTQDFTQFADNGKVVGNLNGAPYVQHAVTYESWLPSFDMHYLAQPWWSMYAQYGKGQNIPPTSVFDVKGALVSTLPKPTLTNTVQFGTVWKARRATLDVDVYHVVFENDYSSTLDQATGMTLYYLNGKSTTQGVEAESTMMLGGGLALYLNGTKGSAKYNDTGLWVQNAPNDTETVGLTYNRSSWNIGFFSKRVGQMFNDNGGTHEAVTIDPYHITNLFLNYTVGGHSLVAKSKVRLAVNNLTDSHAITAVSPASAASNAPSPNDVLTMMAGRSVSLALTVGLSR
ncbi:MAG: TonB-dependent receptor [Acidobacteria bacterium]|nr:TonB-dependent receptor [Acidobacteriota bacterium]